MAKSTPQAQNTGKVFRAESGRCMGSPPFGYKCIQIQMPKRGSRGKHIVVDEDKKQIVIDLFNLYASSLYSLADLSLYVEEKFTIKLSDSVISRILRNKFYIGYLYFCGKEYPHIYEKFIEPKVFDQCNVILDGRKIQIADQRIINQRNKIVEGQLFKVEQGIYCGLPPFGFVRKSNGPRKKYSKLSNIETVPEEITIIKDIFDSYISGSFSIKSLTKYINKKYNKALHATRIERILKNKFYIGVMIYKGKEYPHIYPKIIDNKTFDRVKQISSINNRYFLADKAPDLEKEIVFRAKISPWREELLKQGIWADKLPTGYITKLGRDRLGVNIKNDEIIVDIKRSKSVQYVFDAYKMGIGVCAIARNLRNSDIDKGINASSVRKIIKNKFYIGTITFKGKEYPHHYPLFIDKSLFDSVQNIIKNNDKRILLQQNTIQPEVKQNEAPLTIDEKILIFCKFRKSMKEIKDHFIDEHELNDIIMNLELENKIKEVQPNIFITISF